MKKYFESILSGDEPIITLSYNNANGGFDLGNHIRLYTGYQTDDYEDDFPGFLINLDDYHFKTFEFIKQVFPEVKQVVMACPIFYRDDVHYIKKETDLEGYKLFPCADGDYSEYVREDDFIYLFRTKVNPHPLNLSQIMDYTILVDDSDDDYVLSDRYDEDMHLRFTPQKKYYDLSKEEYKERKKQFKKYRLNKECIKEFDFYYQKAVESDYYIDYDEIEDFVWCEMEDDRYTFPNAKLKVHYGDKFYLFMLKKIWFDHGIDQPYYFMKFTKDKREVEELYNKPLTYFLPYISIDADGEPFTDVYYGDDNINADNWKCQYLVKECFVDDTFNVAQEITDTKTITIKEAGY